MLTSSALLEWVELAEALTRGLVHGFNNRFTAISAYVELAAMGEEEFAPARILPAELVRLQALNSHLRLLLSDDGSPESMEAGPVLDDAVALLAHHPGARVVPCEVTRMDPLPPVRAPRWAFLRLLLVMIEDARRTADASSQAQCRLTLANERDGLSVGTDVRSLSAYGAAMAAACDGTVSSDERGTRVRLPSLAEQRRRDGARRATSDGD